MIDLIGWVCDTSDRHSPVADLGAPAVAKPPRGAQVGFTQERDVLLFVFHEKGDTRVGAVVDRRNALAAADLGRVADLVTKTIQTSDRSPASSGN